MTHELNEFILMSSMSLDDLLDINFQFNNHEKKKTLTVQYEEVCTCTTVFYPKLLLKKIKKIGSIIFVNLALTCMHKFLLSRHHCILYKLF